MKLYKLKNINIARHAKPLQDKSIAQIQNDDKQNFRYNVRNHTCLFYYTSYL